jgi:hypothetical protein
MGLFVIFIGYLVGYVSGAGTIRFMRLPPTSVSRTLAQQPRLSIRSALRDVLHSRRLRGLAIALVIFGFMMYGLRSFEALYLQQLGAPSTIVGLMSTIGATVELPGMLWADRLVRRACCATRSRWKWCVCAECCWFQLCRRCCSCARWAVFLSAGM